MHHGLRGMDASDYRIVNRKNVPRGQWNKSAQYTNVEVGYSREVYEGRTNKLSRLIFV